MPLAYHNGGGKAIPHPIVPSLNGCLNFAFALGAFLTGVQGLDILPPVALDLVEC